jgi:hypothetical protein
MNPSGMSPLDPFDLGIHHGHQSFDLGFGGAFSDNEGPPPSSDLTIMPYATLNYDGHEASTDDQRPSMEDMLRLQGYTSQGSTRRVYPTQDRNPQPPPSQSIVRPNATQPPSFAAAQPEFDSSYPGLDSELAVGNRPNRRSRRNTTVPPAASLPPRRTSTTRPSTASGRKGSPKKGPPTRAKNTRRSARSSRDHGIEAPPQLPGYIDIPTSPTVEALENARTPRGKQALKTWYQRLAELVQYKITNGHSKCADPSEVQHK